MSALLILLLAAAATAAEPRLPPVSAIGHASVTILRSASVGAGLPAPVAGMAPHRIDVITPAGGRQPVLVYEFE